MQAFVYEKLYNTAAHNCIELRNKFPCMYLFKKKKIYIYIVKTVFNKLDEQSNPMGNSCNPMTGRSIRATKNLICIALTVFYPSGT